MRENHHGKDKPVKELGELAEAYINSAQASRTIYERRRDLELFAADNAAAHEVGLSDALGFLLRMPQKEAVAFLTSYRDRKLSDGCAPATVNRLLSSVRGYVRLAHVRGHTALDAQNLVEKLYPAATPPRFITCKQRQELLAVPDPQTLRGARDAAMLHVLCGMPLEGWQLNRMVVSDFDAQGWTLMVSALDSEKSAVERGRVRSSPPSTHKKHPIRLGGECVSAITHYLNLAGHVDDANSALFASLDRRPDFKGAAIDAKSILKFVVKYGRAIGIQQLNITMLRITALMIALEESGGQASVARARFPHVNLTIWTYYQRFFPQIHDEIFQNTKDSFNCRE